MNSSTIFQIVMKNPLYRFMRRQGWFSYLIQFTEWSGLIKRDISKKEIKKLIGEEDVVIIEVGANKGTDTAEFLNTFKRVSIFCFEPDPRALLEFESRINDKRCELYKMAISDQNGEIDFNLSDGSSSEIKRYIGSSSLKKPFKHLDLFPQVTFNEVIKVRTVTLDSWVKEKKINNIDFVWADVQGAERELIVGGQETFLNKVKYLYTEYSNNELYKDQPTLKEILNLLPNYKVIKLFTSNVLLFNTSIANT